MQDIAVSKKKGWVTRVLTLASGLVFELVPTDNEQILAIDTVLNEL